MIWSYLAAGEGGIHCRHYGTPVQVFVPGKGFTRVVYEFGTPEQPCAVVHWQSGRIIAQVKDRHKGYPEERAAAACAEVFEGKKVCNIMRAFDSAPVINQAPKVEGVMAKCQK